MIHKLSSFYIEHIKYKKFNNAFRNSPKTYWIRKNIICKIIGHDWTVNESYMPVYTCFRCGIVDKL